MVSNKKRSQVTKHFHSALICCSHEFMPLQPGKQKLITAFVNVYMGQTAPCTQHISEDKGLNVFSAYTCSNNSRHQLIQYKSFIDFIIHVTVCFHFTHRHHHFGLNANIKMEHWLSFGSVPDSTSLVWRFFIATWIFMNMTSGLIKKQPI